VWVFTTEEISLNTIVRLRTIEKIVNEKAGELFEGKLELKKITKIEEL